MASKLRFSLIQWNDIIYYSFIYLINTPISLLVSVSACHPYGPGSSPITGRVFSHLKSTKDMNSRKWTNSYPINLKFFNFPELFTFARISLFFDYSSWLTISPYSFLCIFIGTSHWVSISFLPTRRWWTICATTQPVALCASTIVWCSFQVLFFIQIHYFITNELNSTWSLQLWYNYSLLYRFFFTFNSWRIAFWRRRSQRDGSLSRQIQFRHFHAQEIVFDSIFRPVGRSPRKVSIHSFSLIWIHSHQGWALLRYRYFLRYITITQKYARFSRVFFFLIFIKIEL